MHICNEEQIALVYQRIYLITGIVEEDYDSVVNVLWWKQLDMVSKPLSDLAVRKNSTLMYDFKGKIRCWDGSELWFR